MTDPIKDATKAIRDQNKVRMAEMTKPAIDSFYDSSAMKEIDDIMSTRRLFDHQPVTSPIGDLKGITASVQTNLDSIGMSQLAQVHVRPFRESLGSVMPDVTTMWKEKFDTSSVMNEMAKTTLAIEIPEINIGIKDALGFNSLLPDIGAQVRESMSQVFAAQDSLRAFRDDLNAVTTSIYANSGIDTLPVGAVAEALDSPEFAEAMRQLIPQMPVMPDVSELTKYAFTDIDLSYLDFVDEQLSSDSNLRVYLKTATSTLVEKLTVSRETAHRIVLTIVWVAWFSTLMTLLIIGNPTVKVVAGAVLSASGKLNADNVAEFVAKRVVPLDE